MGFDPNQPRDSHGRWTDKLFGGGPSTGDGGSRSGKVSAGDLAAMTKLMNKGVSKKKAAAALGRLNAARPSAKRPDKIWGDADPMVRQETSDVALRQTVKDAAKSFLAEWAGPDDDGFNQSFHIDEFLDWAWDQNEYTTYLTPAQDADVTQRLGQEARAALGISGDTFDLDDVRRFLKR